MNTHNMCFHEEIRKILTTCWFKKVQLRGLVKGEYLVIILG